MTEIVEVVRGIVSRVTYHNPDNGWSVLRLSPFNSPETMETVTVHQTQVFAGATMEFHGNWTVHPQYGRQFRAERAIVKKPATASALEKYLGSGLIKGVGPKTAAKIVAHFGETTLDVFEKDIERLVEVPGIAAKKLEMIKGAWLEHRAVREVMIFLQSHGISTLFAVRIFQKYGDQAIALVTEDPYRLANDFYGIGFFSADRVALSIGIARDGEKRLMAAVRHVLGAAREEGHCYLYHQQIETALTALLEISLPRDGLGAVLGRMEQENYLRMRPLPGAGEQLVRCYYGKTLYYDEAYVASRIQRLTDRRENDTAPVAALLERRQQQNRLCLSRQQQLAVCQTVSHHFSVLTGGPGCGKTTTTRVIVQLLEDLGRRVLLAAPTGRAAQRMSEVIGRSAQTLHRLLEWRRGGFEKNEKNPLDCDFLIVDECSMLDISLTASLLKAVSEGCQVLFIGDSDQLPSVGAGNVLRDLIASRCVPVARLTEVFRQARQSKIIGYAHDVNNGVVPHIRSPFRNPEVWQQQEDCLFIDSDEATKAQIEFITRARKVLDNHVSDQRPDKELFTFRCGEEITSAYEKDFAIPDKFQHVDLERLSRARGPVEELKVVLGKVHPWSTLHYGFSAVETVVRLYVEWIGKYFGMSTEIQVLSPMTRGSLGTINLNRILQQAVNPERSGKAQLTIGDRIFRQGDRVIHKRNNYELGVFNGDIGKIEAIDNLEPSMAVVFGPENRTVTYQKDDIVELELAYAITVHKSQGSEFEAVIIPVLTQHFKMLYRNLVYTGVTRAKKLAVLVGTRKALAMAVKREDTAKRQTMLQQLLSKNQ
ncbi:SF1B family DNA helicase RecD2 [Desulforhopalus singaporensis]|uniref:Exodeoxyribonuclease V alpha subunit n=1 Tax=Desulforhopalus singaporensis TaxID=91360 RepID=A0A1H0RKN5_9BACT|nr:AAA family ATPase [Desulforhopalus singaporensis]SDP30015.1 exodeoxyribonuclease V alpha subunit [Desulforhopalus singaporensis]